MIKCDFHIHAGSDIYDKIDYDDFELINQASRLGFDAISITNHGTCAFTKELSDYAHAKGIFLIPGSEIFVRGKHVIVLNINKDDIAKIQSFDDLRKLKAEKDILIVAAHPYFLLPNCLGSELEKNIDIFDAIEYSFFHTKLINLNNKAVRIAAKYSKPVILNSDCHDLKYFGKSFSLIDAEKNFMSIKKAILTNKIKFDSNDLGFFTFVNISIRIIVDYLLRIMRIKYRINCL